jgi:glycosyltransferase involved in cell wall biosynthesis
MMHLFSGKHVLFIVEDLPVPLDRRVWQEALALRDNGAEVSIICPKMLGFDKTFENIAGISIYRHPMPFEATGKIGFIVEYASAIIWEFILISIISIKKRVHVIHGACPPDLIFIPVLLFKLFGVKYVFDHHDASPDIFIANFNEKGFFYKILRIFERLSFYTADRSIAVNSSYRTIAIERGKMSQDSVTVIRNGPDLNTFRLKEPVGKFRKGKRFLVGYMGRIGPLNSLDTFMYCIKAIIAKRKDVHFAILGDGPDLERVIRISEKLGITGFVDFYGLVTDNDLMLDVLNTCDICVNPGISNDISNISTAQKVMEYMALRKPIVQFDLPENHFTAQTASLYAVNNNPDDFAAKIDYLLNNPELRTEMGDIGYTRIMTGLSWEHQSKILIEFYKRILIGKHA